MKDLLEEEREAIIRSIKLEKEDNTEKLKDVNTEELKDKSDQELIEEWYDMQKILSDGALSDEEQEELADEILEKIILE